MAASLVEAVEGVHENEAGVDEEGEDACVAEGYGVVDVLRGEESGILVERQGETMDEGADDGDGAEKIEVRPVLNKELSRRG